MGNSVVPKCSYDLVVVGGGPAGSAAAIYSARKGLHVAIVAERLGGKVYEKLPDKKERPERKTCQVGESLTWHVVLCSRRRVRKSRSERNQTLLRTRSSKAERAAFAPSPMDTII